MPPPDCDCDRCPAEVTCEIGPFTGCCSQPVGGWKVIATSMTAPEVGVDITDQLRNKAGEWDSTFLDALPPAFRAALDPNFHFPSPPAPAGEGEVTSG